MKSLLTILGVLFIRAFPIIAEDHISSKFTRLTCTVLDKVLIVNESCIIKPISRNETIINLYAYLTHEVDDILIHLQLFKKFSVYKPFLVNVKEEFCKLFTKKSTVPYTKILSRIAAPYTNIHHSCPYIGEVSLKNMVLDPNRLRPLWPVGDYRADIEIMANKRPTPSVTIQIYLEIKEVVR